jgi:putative hydrolase of HD superfamily
MSSYPSPEVVVQRQLEAYNARDIDALLATYAQDARQYEHPGKLVASGHAQMRERFAIRFQEPNLHARLIKRSVMGNVVIDFEDISRTFPEGTGRVELVAIYEVHEGRIQTGSFISGAKTLDMPAK